MTNAKLGRLFSSVSAVAFCLVTLPVFAQTAPTPATDEDVIIVTGSRITRPEIAFPNPVVSVSADMLLQSGKTDITSVLLDTPALIGSLGNGANAGSNSQNAGGASGAGNVGTTVLDLRNLGSACAGRKSFSSIQSILTPSIAETRASAESSVITIRSRTMWTTGWVRALTWP